MNESDFENGLRTLRPAEPSPELEDRIAVALEARLLAVPAAGVIRQPRIPGAWSRLLHAAGWMTAGAGAGVAAMLALYPAHPQPAAPAVVPAASLFVPSESTREALASEDQGTVYGGGDEPSRLVRYTSIERHAWTNPATGAWLQVETPREDLVALPVSYQ